MKGGLHAVYCLEDEGLGTGGSHYDNAVGSIGEAVSHILCSGNVIAQPGSKREAMGESARSGA